MTDAPTLLPPEPAADPSLPRWVLPVALLGLVVLFASALPALLTKRRLDRQGREIEEQLHAAELRLEAVRREKVAIENDSFVREQALQSLLSPGRAPRPKPR